MMKKISKGSASAGSRGKFCCVMLSLSLLIAMIPGLAGATTLDIPPRAQETRVWCWVAVSEMALRHYGLPNINPGNDYQCGIVAQALPQQCLFNCRNMGCEVPAGSADRIVESLETYGQIVNDEISSEHLDEALSQDQVVFEIERGNPLIAGISPSGAAPAGVSQHVALIVGYDDDGETLVVNDPYPFDELNEPNPYVENGAEPLRPGRYRIKRSSFIDDLRWAETIRVANASSLRDLPTAPDEAGLCETITEFAENSSSYAFDLRAERLWSDSDRSVRLSKKVIDDMRCRIERVSDNNKDTMKCFSYFDEYETARDEYESLVSTARRCIGRVNETQTDKFEEQDQSTPRTQITTFYDDATRYKRSIDVELSSRTQMMGGRVRVLISTYTLD